MSESESGVNESFGVECPTCGQECASNQGMKSHHVKKHGVSIAEPKHGENGKYECPRPHCDYLSDDKHGIVCHHSLTHGGPAYPNPFHCDECGTHLGHLSHSEIFDNNFCGKRCRNNFDSDVVGFNCDYCGEYEEQSPSAYEGSKYHYCSGKCARRDGGDMPSQYTDRVDVDCLWCGTTLQRLECNIKASGRVFCPQNKTDCYSQWISQHISGENHYNWKDKNVDPHSYGGMWRTKRIEALDRDGHECQSCEMSEEDHIDWCGVGLEVHHLVPYRTFDDPYKANKLSNLKTLCKSCHAQYELHSKEQIVA